MPTVHEHFSEQFLKWEKRGRGWQVFDEPVYPEPPFAPFAFRAMDDPPVADDGVRESFLGSLARKLSQKLGTPTPAPPPIPQPEEEPEPIPFIRDSLIELLVSLPTDLDIKHEALEQVFRSLTLCQQPVAFELLGTHGRVAVQFAASAADMPLVRKQMEAHCPDAEFQESENALLAAWEQSQGEEIIAVEFGLEREFMFQLATGKLDPFVGIVAALSELQPGELGLFQVLWQALREPWTENILHSVTHSDGKPLFVNYSQLTKAAESKAKSPLYAAVVRIMLRTANENRLQTLARELAGALRVFINPEGNALIPLHNEDYPFEEHIEDVLLRQSRRTGMILTGEELAGFVHLPGSSVRSSALKRDAGLTKAAPASVLKPQKLLLGYNEHAGAKTPVYLSPDQRMRHAHLIGAPGTGKSTFIYNLITQDIQNGEGVAVFDPHGDLIEKILGSIPPERIEDVILLDLGDEEYSVPFNILSAHSEREKRLIASDLTAVFQRLSTSWGDQMTSVLNNTVVAFLESSQGGTLADMRRFLIEPAYRAQFLKTVSDPNVVYYWQKGFPQLVGNKSIGPLLTRLDMLLAPKPISHMVSQKENRLDFSAMMNEGKIFLAKLSQGEMGYENSCLMGSLLMAKFHLAAIARQNIPESQRRDFFIFLDEAHNFATPSMVEILTGARKYRVGLTFAHHELGQLDRVKEIAGAVLGCNVRIVFRVGDGDARKLAEGFSHFEARDLQNLETGHGICKVERTDHDFNLSIPFPEAVDPTQARATREAVVQSSRAKYATPRAEIEKALWQALRTEEQAEPVRKVRKNAEAFGNEPKYSETGGSIPKPSEPAGNLPKVSDHSLTASEKEAPKPQDAALQQIPVKPAGVPEDKGIGGHQHNLIRERIQGAARELGFHAEREKATATGQKIDLALERQRQVIACEISIMTTVDHEVGNVSKCLKAGCQHVAVICPIETRLEKIRKAVAGCIASEEASRVGYYLPEQFIEYLKSIKPAEGSPAEAQPAVLGKFKVKVRAATTSAEEIARREAMAHKAIASAMKRKP